MSLRVDGSRRAACYAIAGVTAIRLNGFSNRLLGATLGLVAAIPSTVVSAQDGPPNDPLRALQEQSIRDKDTERERVYAFGWQGLDGVFSTHTTHSNRPVPFVAFGPYASLDDRTGLRSPYRSRESLAEIFGAPPPRSVDERNEYGDQTGLHRLLLGAANRGAKRIVVLLMDGGDWNVYQAASTVLHGENDLEGFGRGLAWFEYQPDLPSSQAARAIGAVITTPLRDRVPPGFDVARGGRHPWSKQDANYLAGQHRRDAGGRPRVVGGVHAVVDSAASATAIFTGQKTLNGRVSFGADGEPLLPLGRQLQHRGWQVATVTDVPFDHASPACVYASVAARKEYPQIGRQMLGLADFEGADIVLGYGYGQNGRYLAEEDLQTLRDRGDYLVVSPETGEDGDALLLAGAIQVAQNRMRVARAHRRLFGFFGDASLDHAPYRTADGRYDPSASLNYDGSVAKRESYTEEQRQAMPTLLEMTKAATVVLDAAPLRPSLLFVEAGLVDWSQHANNLDHCVGEVGSAEETFEFLVEWIEASGGWEDTLLLVTSDHGHLLQVDYEALRKTVHGAR